jgi:hypothetical protein
MALFGAFSPRFSKKKQGEVRKTGSPLHKLRHKPRATWDPLSPRFSHLARALSVRSKSDRCAPDRSNHDAGPPPCILLVNPPPSPTLRGSTATAPSSGSPSRGSSTVVVVDRSGGGAHRLDAVSSSIGQKNDNGKKKRVLQKKKNLKAFHTSRLNWQLAFQ